MMQAAPQGSLPTGVGALLGSWLFRAVGSAVACKCTREEQLETA